MGWNQNATSTSICTKPMRLSLRRTWHSSCAMTASCCSELRCSKKPVGNSRTGRKTPNTPGSRNELDAIAGTESPSGTRDPARTEERIRLHRIQAVQAIPTKPIAQIIARIGGSDSAGWLANDAEEPVEIVNGWLA